MARIDAWWVGYNREKYGWTVDGPYASERQAMDRRKAVISKTGTILPTRVWTGGRDDMELSGR